MIGLCDIVIFILIVINIYDVESELEIFVYIVKFEVNDGKVLYMFLVRLINLMELKDN